MVSDISKLLYFLFPAWPEIDIYIWKIDFIALEVAWAILSTM